MRNHKSVLISGASVAGPALAFWLARAGWSVTVVEKAPALRRGGQAVDFKGATHRTVLERMGLLADVQARQTDGHDQTVIDARGRSLAVIPGAFTGGDVEIRRGELAGLLYERTASSCEYLFGDTISGLAEGPGGVDVEFASGAGRRFDLVVGADGIHSQVRRLAFGPEERFVRFLGHYYALAEIGDPGLGGQAVMYNEPGRMVAVGGPKAPAFFVFASPALSYDRDDPAAGKQVVQRVYRGSGWRVAELLDRLEQAEDFYLDSLSQARLDTYHRGRVVLLGDAAYGNTLGGFGTGLAVVGAYVLAGELTTAEGEHRAAFRGYQDRMRPYAAIARQGSAGPFLAPKSRSRIRLRNAVFQRRLLLRLMMRMTDRYATDIDLRGYPSLTARP
ncbi:FAD-dependent monooxygenase [Amycolatopsis alkalitolerans]|uniref:FAD-dependent oxidoreductase n=1 Tax=Amycolatopsis alkalitolerans TaxID=2547244 RepID=A0A5C4LV70_9PSEU|nr:FAD-dependent monooxygenase [Amycolatopsis alkalitolerans]TNC22397.1 FAD-dependent oxidoreductase [Amycolatopsis alkalitolerans]